MIYEADSCLLLNTVMAARSMTRRYDERLRGFGVSVIQFSILAVLRKDLQEPVSRTAERVAMDRTTLLRNLELLVRKELVRAYPVERGNGRRFRLTDRGKALVEEIMPHWRHSQEELRELLEGFDPDNLLNALKTLTAG